MTYYSGNDWVFDIDTVKNGMDIDKGYMYDVYKSIGTKTVHILHYTNLTGKNLALVIGLSVGDGVMLIAIIIGISFAAAKSGMGKN